MHGATIEGWQQTGTVPQSVHESKEEHNTRTEPNQFRAVLTARIAELERFTRNRDAITVERSADQLDEIQAASQRALAVCNLDREFNQLRNARRALRRIEAGSHGICQECDQDTHPKRLAAVPWAHYCIRCQEAIDGNLEEIQAPSSALLGRAACGSEGEVTC